MDSRQSVFRMFEWSTRLPVLVGFFSAFLCSHTRGIEPAEREFFEREVRPLLVEQCYECHSGGSKKLQASLRVDGLAHLVKGGDSGTAVVPGKPDESLLIQAIRYDGFEMPPRSKLPAEKIAILERWVAMGAPWPENDPASPDSSATPANPSNFDVASRRENHWCWQPLKEPAVAPPGSNSTSQRDRPNANPVRQDLAAHAWVGHSLPVDSLVDEALIHAGLAATSSTDMAAWARRLAFDLTGLPPEPTELERLSADLERNRPDAARRYLDRLLASPDFGEHWARYWLDLVHYSETRGHEFDPDIRGARFYRDYTIRAWNQDLPYPQLVREHIAGDLLETPRIDPVSGINESIIGTAFWHLSEWIHSPVDTLRDESDRVDIMIDTFSKTFQGVTLACARCHDHKFDAISTDDYYALAAILKCSEHCEVRFASQHANQMVAKELDQLRTGWQASFASSVAALAKAESERCRAVTQLDPVYEQAGFQERLERWFEPKAKAKAKASSDPTSGSLQEKGSRLAGIPAERIVVNYEQPGSPFLTNGESFGIGPRKAGAWLVLQSPQPKLALARFDAASRDEAWYSLTDTPDPAVNEQSRLDSFPRAARTWRSPTFQLQSGELHYLVRGAGYAFVCIDSHRQIFGPLHGQVIREFKAEEGTLDEPRWIRHDVQPYAGSWTHIEITSNTNLPLEILAVIQGPPPSAKPADRVPIDPTNRPRLIADALDEISRSIKGETPWQPERLDLAAWWVDHLPELASRVAVATPAILAEPSASAATGGQIGPAPSQTEPAWAESWRVYQQALNQSSEQQAQLYQRIVRESPVTPAMWEGTSQPSFVAIRGDPHRNGRPVPRRTMEALGGAAIAEQASSSGRQLLAEVVIDRENPLTWRVMANRVWQQLMGRALSNNPDDFGVLGEAPTHPRLLDFLACRLRDDGSIKHLIRRIASSKVYARDCQPIAESLAKDPENRLWHYRPPRRMTAEMVRDAMLATSGRLERRSPSASIPLHLTDYMDGRGRPKSSGPIDGAGRRSIYLAVRRNFLSPMFQSFDLPAPTVTRGKRSFSNVPSQALTMLNDPLVMQLRSSWSKRMGSVPGDFRSRARQMVQDAWGQAPDETQARIIGEFVDEVAATRGEDAALQDLAHVLWNSKEFLFIR